MKIKLARMLRKLAALIDPPVKSTKATTNIGTLTVRIEADTEAFMKEMESVEQIVRRAIAATDALKARVPSAS